jgi:hypothetical protein
MDSKSQIRYKNARIRRELELGDTERQIQEAEATIARFKEKFIADKEAWEKTKVEEAERIQGSQGTPRK